MMLKKFLCVFSLFIFSLSHARAGGGPTGLGGIAGDPTGVSVKHWLSPQSALDAAFAWNLGRNSAFGIHADYLLHVPTLMRAGDAAVPLHYGIGGLLVFSKASAFAVRIPVGVSHRFQRHPVDIFAELAALLFLAPDTDFDVHGGVGARYYF